MKTVEDIYQMIKAKNTIDELGYIKKFIEEGQTYEEIKEWVNARIQSTKDLFKFIDKL